MRLRLAPRPKRITVQPSIPPQDTPGVGSPRCNVKSPRGGVKLPQCDVKSPQCDGGTFTNRSQEPPTDRCPPGSPPSPNAPGSEKKAEPPREDVSSPLSNKDGEEDDDNVNDCSAWSFDPSGDDDDDSPPDMEDMCPFEDVEEADRDAENGDPTYDCFMPDGSFSDAYTDGVDHEEEGEGEGGGGGGGGEDGYMPESDAYSAPNDAYIGDFEFETADTEVADGTRDTDEAGAVEEPSPLIENAQQPQRSSPPPPPPHDGKDNQDATVAPESEPLSPLLVDESESTLPTNADVLTNIYTANEGTTSKGRTGSLLLTQAYPETKQETVANAAGGYENEMEPTQPWPVENHIGEGRESELEEKKETPRSVTTTTTMRSSLSRGFEEKHNSNNNKSANAPSPLPQEKTRTHDGESKTRNSGPALYTQTGPSVEERALAVLRRHWGPSAMWRSCQLEAIKATLSGQDCFVSMNTGGGKSLCYQIPAVIRSGTTVVISPLIALMQDQVGALIKRGIAACHLSSDQSDATAAMRMAREGNARLVYLAPERMEGCTLLLKSLVESGRLTSFAIDEAHCVSEWGCGFRPNYRELGERLRRLYPRVPIIALTATATPQTRTDVCRVLGLRDPLILATSFDRPNLFFAARDGGTFSERIRALTPQLLGVKPSPHIPIVSPFANKRTVPPLQLSPANGRTGAMGDRNNNDVKDEWSKEHDGCVLVYVLRRKDAEEAANHLRAQGVDARAYHAKMTGDLKRDVLRRFSAGQLRVVCATVAFGMGVDRANVRRVINIGAPPSLEAYYQQVGRAGRDGQPALCLLLHGAADGPLNQRLAHADADNVAAATSHYNGNSAGVENDDDVGEVDGGDEWYGGADAGAATALSSHKHISAAVMKTRSQERWSEMHAYCVGARCRRAILLEHFSQGDDRADLAAISGNLIQRDPAQCCDVCSAAINKARAGGGDGGALTRDVTRHARAIVKCISELPRAVGEVTLAGILRGTPSQLKKVMSTVASMEEAKRRISTYGALSDTSQEFIRAVVCGLCDKKVSLLTRRLIKQGVAMRAGGSVLLLSENGKMFMADPKLKLKPIPLPAGVLSSVDRVVTNRKRALASKKEGNAEKKQKQQQQQQQKKKKTATTVVVAATTGKKVAALQKAVRWVGADVAENAAKVAIATLGSKGHTEAQKKTKDAKDEQSWKNKKANSSGRGAGGSQTLTTLLTKKSPHPAATSSSSSPDDIEDFVANVDSNGRNKQRPMRVSLVAENERKKPNVVIDMDDADRLIDDSMDAVVDAVPESPIPTAVSSSRNGGDRFSTTSSSASLFSRSQTERAKQTSVAPSSPIAVGRQLLRQSPQPHRPSLKATAQGASSSSSSASSSHSDGNGALLKALVAHRALEALMNNVEDAEQGVCSSETLDAMVRHRPTSIEALFQLAAEHDLENKLVDTFGAGFLNVISRFCSARKLATDIGFPADIDFPATATRPMEGETRTDEGDVYPHESEIHRDKGEIRISENKRLDLQTSSLYNDRKQTYLATRPNRVATLSSERPTTTLAASKPAGFTVEIRVSEPAPSPPPPPRSTFVSSAVVSSPSSSASVSGNNTVIDCSRHSYQGVFPRLSAKQARERVSAAVLESARSFAEGGADGNGESPQAIAARRKLRVATVMAHLAEAVAVGYRLKWAQRMGQLSPALASIPGIGDSRWLSDARNAWKSCVFRPNSASAAAAVVNNTGLPTTMTTNKASVATAVLKCVERAEEEKSSFSSSSRSATSASSSSSSSSALRLGPALRPQVAALLIARFEAEEAGHFELHQIPCLASHNEESEDGNERGVGIDTVVPSHYVRRRRTSTAQPVLRPAYPHGTQPPLMASLQLPQEADDLSSAVVVGHSVAVKKRALSSGGARSNRALPVPVPSDITSLTPPSPSTLDIDNDDDGDKHDEEPVFGAQSTLPPPLEPENSSTTTRYTQSLFVGNICCSSLSLDTAGVFSVTPKTHPFSSSFTSYGRTYFCNACKQGPPVPKAKTCSPYCY